MIKICDNTLKQWKTVTEYDDMKGGSVFMSDIDFAWLEWKVLNQVVTYQETVSWVSKWYNKTEV